MAQGKYNRRNYLLRVIEVQDIYQKHHARGVTDTYIYNEIIYNQFKISRTTFYNYLAVTARKQLKEIEEQMLLDQKLKSI